MGAPAGRPILQRYHRLHSPVSTTSILPRPNPAQRPFHSSFAPLAPALSSSKPLFHQSHTRSFFSSIAFFSICRLLPRLSPSCCPSHFRYQLSASRIPSYFPATLPSFLRPRSADRPYLRVKSWTKHIRPGTDLLLIRSVRKIIWCLSRSTLLPPPLCLLSLHQSAITNSIMCCP